jgi:hypothetical protein
VTPKPIAVGRAQGLSGKEKNMKYLAILLVSSLALACHSGKSPSYAAQGGPVIEVGGTGNRYTAQHSRLSASMIPASKQSPSAMQKAEPY